MHVANALIAIFGLTVAFCITMFCDLNVPWPTRDSPTVLNSKKSKKQPQKKAIAEDDNNIQEALDLLTPSEKQRMSELTYELMEMGYTTLAFNHVVRSKYDPVSQKYPFGKSHCQPPFPKLDPRTRKAHGIEAYRAGIKQLSRLTVVFDSDEAVKSGSGFVSANAQALQQYDLLSVTPTTETAFQHACITLSELKPFSIDIISLDLAAAPRLPFYLKRSTVGAALANGVVFEITYGAAVANTQDTPDVSAARRNLFAGARDLLRATNGKGVIISSSALDALGIRAPYDVMNLAALMGMTPNAAKDAISTTCQSLMIRAETRQTFRGTVSKPYVLPAEHKPTSGIDESSKKRAKRKLSNDDECM